MRNSYIKSKFIQKKKTLSQEKFAFKTSEIKHMSLFQHTCNCQDMREESRFYKCRIQLL